MDTHQQPSSRDIAEDWYKALPEIVMPQTVGERRWTVRPEEVAALLTSHSQAIRERVNFLRKPFKGCELADHDRSYLAALNDILALLNDSEV